MNNINNANSKVALSRILHGLDISMGKNYVHADVISKYFPDFELSGVYTVEVDYEGKACIEFIKRRSRERHILDLIQLDAKTVAGFLRELMGHISTEFIIMLDGEVWLSTDITEKSVITGWKLEGQV